MDSFAYRCNIRRCQSGQGQLPIHFVPLLTETVIRQILIGHGVKLDIVDKSGWTPLHIAAAFGTPEVVKVHSSHGRLSYFHLT